MTAASANSAGGPDVFMTRALLLLLKPRVEQAAVGEHALLTAITATVLLWAR